MVNWKNRKTGDLLLLANGLVVIVLINMLAARFVFRLDLTEEKRYSIDASTRAMLSDLDDVVYVDVYLAGELNAGFRRFQKSLRETLDMFRLYSGNRVQYNFIDPASAASPQARQEFMAELASKGIQPTNVIDTRDGARVEKIIFPGVVVSYGGAEKGVMLLKGNKAATPEEEINQSIEGIEFEIASAIYSLTNENPALVGLLRGHGELEGAALSPFRRALADRYAVRDVHLDDPQLSAFAALVIAKPVRPFSQVDQYRLDQYIMDGGRVLFLVDRLDASMDSISRERYLAFPYETGLEDQLFRYGVRINPDLVQDRYAARHPIITGERPDGTPQIHMLEWPFFPLINRFADHAITRNLDRVLLRFASSIDTVKAEGVRKTPLLMTSAYSRRLTAPVNVNVNELRRDLSPEKFTEQHVPVAFLLEGEFVSLFRNRFLPPGVDEEAFRASGAPTALVVVSDGDIARSELHPRTGEPLGLGRDPFANYTFANEDFLLNAIAYLVDADGLLRARTREVRIRPLDREQIAQETLKWQAINLGLPLVIIVVLGVVRAAWRRKRYASF